MFAWGVYAPAPPPYPSTVLHAIVIPCLSRVFLFLFVYDFQNNSSAVMNGQVQGGQFHLNGLAASHCDEINGDAVNQVQWNKAGYTANQSRAILHFL